MGLSSKQVSLDHWSHHPTLLQSETLDLTSMKQPPVMAAPVPAGKRQQQHQQESLNCPRCDSANTKFCYYNNYNKSQPRYLCKACKRHWTKGGTLRNVPVGGGRKNKRHKTSHSSKPSASAAAKVATAAAVTTGGSVKNGISYNTHLGIQGKSLSFPNFGQNPVNTTINGGFINGSSTVTSQTQDHQTLIQLPFSPKTTSFDTTPSAVSTYSMEDPAGISGTTVMATTRSVGDLALQQPSWRQLVSSTSSGMEMMTSSYLNWDIDDFDTFVSHNSNNLNVPWDDYYDIKP